MRVLCAAKMAPVIVIFEYKHSHQERNALLCWSGCIYISRCSCQECALAFKSARQRAARLLMTHQIRHCMRQCLGPFHFMG